MPRKYASLRESHRRVSCGRVYEIVYCLFLCRAIRKPMRIEEITGQAVATYPQYFYTWINDDYVPDMAIVMVTLDEAVAEKFVAGNWQGGWHLTQRGVKIAKDIERRRRAH